MPPAAGRRLTLEKYSRLRVTSALIVHEKRPSRRLPHDCHMIIVRQFLTTEYGQSM
jgi:hypothetical protein